MSGKRDAPPAYSDLFPGMIRDVRSQVDGARHGEGSAPAPVAVPMTLCDVLCKSCKLIIYYQALIVTAEKISALVFIRNFTSCD